MKLAPGILIATCLTWAAGMAGAQTLDWGSEVGSDIVDSNGNPIDNFFVIEIGAFVEDFIPDETNVDLWFANWRVFDQATYNPTLGYFTSFASMNGDGTSASPFASAGFSFQGLEGFLWIRRGDEPIAGNEWLLTRAASTDPLTNWLFPTADPDCCNNETNLQWSVSDLDSDDVPLWGNQGGIEGPGEYTVTGGYTLQTYTFIPEPTSGLFALISGGLLLRRRR